MIATGTRQSGVRKRGWQRSGTDFQRCVTEPEPVGEASRAGKLPQSSRGLPLPGWKLH